MTMTGNNFSFGSLLQTFRNRRQFTQQQLAETIGVTRRTLGRWERGDSLPASKALVLELARCLKLDEQETRPLLEASLTACSPYWLVPLPRNPYFTGREEILETLHRQLGVGQAVALTQSLALHGLGGIGKTQIALEYAYRHTLDYSAVFWIGAETEEQIISSLLRIAEGLHLPERDDKDQQRALTAVQRWLATHGQWLLIWDNLEDLALVERFLPPVRHGAVLITTRSQTLGTLAQGLELLPMAQEEGMLFLLRRAKVLSLEATSEHLPQVLASNPDEYRAAAELVQTLGGLPLALDQAGAYLEETGCGLPGYLHRYDQHRSFLLDRRGGFSRAHPHSVTMTFRLLLEQLERDQPAAADVLRLCSFLHADAIPEELVVAGAASLGPVLAPVAADSLRFDQVMATLRNLSLVQRQPEVRLFSLHRLVQAVIRNEMEAELARLWMERVVEAADAACPEPEVATWPTCERIVPHALLCLHSLPEDVESLALASLSSKIARYLFQRGAYREVEALYHRAVRIRIQILGPDHPDVASVLYGLATLFFEQGRFEEAEPLYHRALSIGQQTLGMNHPQVAQALTDLAVLYTGQGHYTQAEPLFQQALLSWEHTLKPDRPQVVSSLYGLATLTFEQGRYEEAEPLYQRALRMWQHTLGMDHPHVGRALYSLAALFYMQGHYAQAEPLFQQAQHIWEEAVGLEHPWIAYPLAGLADLLCEQGHYAQADLLYQRVLCIREQQLGRDHPGVGQTLYDLALLRQKQGKLNEACALAQRALTIRAQVLGDAHPKTIATRTLLAQLVQDQEDGTEPPLEQLQTLLKARGWSLHLKKRRGKPYVYATRRVGMHTQSRYLAPLSNPAACLAAVETLPSVRE
jgi:tetratricopeptide (TPR) repeat protein/DNA-binding XRE family transcriptional regulator